MSSLFHLIINADDGFYSTPRDRGIAEGMALGQITEVSLIMNGFIAKQLCEVSSKRGVNPLYDFIIEHNIIPGLHMNITEGIPLSEGCVWLVNDNYEMLGKKGLSQKIKSGELLNFEEVEKEMEMQMLQYISLFGRPPLHVDGHQHSHILPGINICFAKILKKYNVPFTRVPIEWFPERMSSQPTKGFFEEVMKYSRLSIKIFNEYNLRYSRFIGMALMGRDLTVDNIKFSILNIGRQDLFNKDRETEDFFNERLVKEVVELMVHPGYLTKEDGGCSSFGPDLFSQSEDRVYELKLLQSKELIKILNENKLKLTNYLSVSKLNL